MPRKRETGSTWYADQFADDIDESCVAQLDIDSPGCADATVYEEVMWMAEADRLCRSSIQDALGFNPQQEQLLDQVARENLDRCSQIKDEIGKVTFGIRMHMTAEEQVPPALHQRMQQLEAERLNVTQRSMDRLKAALGDKVFQALEQYVQSHARSRGFFPVIGRGLPAPQPGRKQ